MSTQIRRTKKEEKIASQKGKEINAFVAMITFALGLAVGYLIWGARVQPSVAQAPQAPQVQQEAAPAVVRDIPTEGFPSEGPDDAPVVIVEFSDFECPFCTKWHNETYLPLREKYPDEIKLVYRNFPLTGLHPNAYLAAEAAMCAGDQDRYWDYHEALFENKNGMGEAAFKGYAEELGLDMETFNECLDSRQYQDFVREDMDYAASIGVQSTPTFYINGRVVVGAQPLQVFEQIIQEELAKAE